MAIYFASDVHLGLQFKSQSADLIESRFVEWLKSIEHDCEKLFLVGDVFDFWFEWKRVVPKGFVRLFGQLAHMSDRGIEINLFAGNHDIWLSDYFEYELGVRIFQTPQVFDLQGKRVYVAHGDNLGERPWLNKVLNSTFRSKMARWFFSRLIHPDAAVRFGQWWSSKSRHGRGNVSHEFRGEEEYLVKFARSCKACDYFVFGHLHTPIMYPLSETSTVVVLGEWIVKPAFARMIDGVIELIDFKV